MRHLRRQRSPIIGRVFHASARTRPAATSSAAVSPWTPNAFESFPPFVWTIRASAVGVIAAATSTQPSVVRPADAQATSSTTPEAMSRAPLISVRPRRLSAAIPKSRVAWRGCSMKRAPRTTIATDAMSPTIPLGSSYLQGIDNADIIETVHARRAPMIPPAPRYGYEDLGRRSSREGALALALP